jgi:hypothetical protein
MIKLFLNEHFVESETALVAESSILCNYIFCDATKARHFYKRHKTHLSTLDLLQKSENTLKPSASIGVYLPDICGCSMTRRFLQGV